MNTIKTMLLMMFMGMLLLTVGALVGGIDGLIIALIFAIGFNFFSFWFSDRLALAMTKARKSTPHEQPTLHAIVDKQVAMVGMAKPTVYIIENTSPNAFATGRSPQKASIAVTTGIIKLLTPQELGAVIAHELAHVGNRDTLIMTMVATVASAIGIIAWMAKFSLIFGGFGGGRRGGSTSTFGIVGLIILAIVIPLLATIVRMAISRTREFQADATGAKTCGDPHTLANALEKLDRGSKQVPMESNQAISHMFIVEPLQGQSLSFMNGRTMMKLFSTHPPTSERVNRLRSMDSGW
jgi:heat shock protein HtpX